MNTHFTFDPKDFIREPYVTCPKCGNHTFGILLIDSDRFLRRCRNCFYPRPGEEQAIFPLLPLNKKIIYLDQLVISNMMKSVNPTTKAHRKGIKDSFWKIIYEKLAALGNLQLIVCPTSDFHHFESMLTPEFHELQKMSSILSHEVSFYHHEDIWRFQIFEQFKVWLAIIYKSTIERQTVMVGDINAWTDIFAILIKHTRQQDVTSEIRQSRQNEAKALLLPFQRWSKETNRDFDAWYEEERNAWATAIADLYIKQYTKYADSVYGYKKVDVENYLPNFGTLVFHEMQELLEQRGLSFKDRLKKIGEFFKSEEFKNTPYIVIHSLLLAALARKVASGMKDPPGTGLATDIRMAVTLLPYCDAMFVDNEMRGLLAEVPLSDRIPYGTKIFSYKTKDEFLAFLDEIRSGASPEHLSIVKEIYGSHWEESNLKLNNN